MNSVPSGGVVPVLFDTDIGSDIDDAFALAYLLRQPRCELVGITTVSGAVDERAACAEAVCRAAGRADVPIHTGLSDVLLGGPGQPEVPHYPSIKGDVADRDWPGDAVLFMRDVIRQRPGEITLLSVGPLTNVAVLFALDPDIPDLLGGFVSMAGMFEAGGSGLEWNAVCDPTAAGVVYDRAPAGHVSVGVDVTMRCHMNADDVRARMHAPPLDAVAPMAEAYFAAQAQAVVFHDPLAAAVVFRPELCAYADGLVTAGRTNAANGWAQTSFTRQDGGPHRVAVDVDVDGFFAEYFGIVA